MLADTGTQIVKCFLHISPEWRSRRSVRRPALTTRQSTGNSAWAISMCANNGRFTCVPTSASQQHQATAPWYVIPANDKLHRNLMIAELLSAPLRNMKLAPPEANPALAGLRE